MNKLIYFHRTRNGMPNEYYYFLEEYPDCRIIVIAPMSRFEHIIGVLVIY